MPDFNRLKISNPGIIPVWLWNELVDAVQSATVTSFIGGSFARTLGGTALFAKKSIPGSASELAHPFQVVTRAKEEGGYEAKVELNSSLYKSLRPNDKVPITGLDTWFDLIGNDAIWLGVVFDSGGGIVSASIDSWGQSDVFEIDQVAWSGSNGYCEDDGGSPPAHQTSRKLIAYTVADDEGNPVVFQEVFHNQLLRDSNIDGRAAKYLFDTSGGYPIS